MKKKGKTKKKMQVSYCAKCLVKLEVEDQPWIYRVTCPKCKEVKFERMGTL